jgi:hypothetical protein
MTTATRLPATEVATFAGAVRTALADLPPDELDELTDGLEADLAERLEESPDAAAGLGDPLAYAEELRAAAGYPPRSARSHLGDTLPNLRTLPQELRRRWGAQLAKHAWLRSVVEFFVALRPVWWVLRGIAAYAVLAWFLGFAGQAFWLIGAALVVLSVQVGRGRMLTRAWVRWVTRVVSAIAIIAAPFLIGGALTTWNNAQYAGSYYEGPSYQPGLNRSGQQIDNIFAYDAEGNPIDEVQLFDQNGDPLNLVDDTSAQFWGAQDGSMVVPNGDVPGRAGWNVFPLAHADSWSDYENDGVLDESEISETPFPSTHVKPLSGSEAAGAPSPEMTPAPVAAPAG